jgi:methylenetetrahydrofolate dehydrogenase (NADP+)/methenyltetrahydrofolate cyclohydrolase
MIIDGRALAAKLKAELALKFKPFLPIRLEVILVGEDPASLKFVEIKERFAQALGVTVRRHEFPAEVLVEDLKELLVRLAADEKSQGIIIQLPLPAHLNAEELIKLIPAGKDVDALTTEARVLPPVAGAVAEILHSEQIKLAGTRAVVIGKGRLVGAPVAVWLTQAGASVTVADSKTEHLPELLKTADIIVSGVGKAHFIKPEMLKDEVILIDAGTSDLPAGLSADKAGEAGAAGELAGDADPACATVCHLFTPVPGGVGPITVAKLFENLLYLIS